MSAQSEKKLNDKIKKYGYQIEKIYRTEFNKNDSPVNKRYFKLTFNGVEVSLVRSFKEAKNIINEHVHYRKPEKFHDVKQEVFGNPFHARKLHDTKFIQYRETY